ncbi:hypothetical protein [Stenomitos frigidus]|uniref:Uncharacterized protein n=1 Tax=Stenomitos frigidus ULC18 TaxID=2107698 RepID=A0A2T1EGE2_9CYAN|nr:hypothetical protein [Stenomitos frigidus]PSB31832.1 hypothetical protein C7B82_06305 [Stenomitos frigidus ULC18]
MSFFNANVDVDGRSFRESKVANADLLSREAVQPLDFNVHLEKLALFLAQTWKDDHPDATAESEADLSHCILAVTAELAIAAQAVGGPISLEILTGGGSAAARAVCQQVLGGNCG